MNAGEDRGKNIKRTDRTLRSEGPPSQHYLALTGIEQYSALAGINSALQNMSESLSSAESVAEELREENTKRESITDQLAESANSLPVETQDHTTQPLVQQRIEQFESRSRSQSRENLDMASLQDDKTHEENVQEYQGENGEENDYDQYDSEDDQVTSQGHHENFETDFNHIDFSQPISGPNIDFDVKIQPYITKFQSELKVMGKELATGPSGGRTYSNIASSLVMDPSSGATTKNQHSIPETSLPTANNSTQVHSQHTGNGSAGVRGSGTVDANSNIRANDGSTSNEWALFQQSVKVLGFEFDQELPEIRNMLNSSPSVTRIKYCMKEIQKNLEKLKRTENRGEEMALKMLCPNRAELNKYINSYSKAFSQLEVHAEELLENIKPAPQDPSILAIGNLAQNLLGAAYAKPIELPEYDGECISDYTPFKEKFRYVIGHCNTPKELWAQHLENSLKGKAQRYIGNKGSWFNKYEELWAHLDNKYANR